MFENIRVIAADIDGTITKSDRTTSKENIECIRKCQDNYIFGLASGRPVEDIISRYEQWGLDKQFDFIIGWNGCQLYDNKTKKTNKYNYLSRDELKEIVDFMSIYESTICMYKPNGIYLSSKESDRAWYSAFKNKRIFTSAKSLSDFYDEDNGGIMFRINKDEMPEIEKSVQQIKNKNYIGFKTQPDLIEFCHKDCCKGVALRKYCEIYNISLDDCMAFGDTTNDNEMLKACVGVCLKSGSEDTKNCAKYLTEKNCDEDGFADFIYKNLLNK